MGKEPKADKYKRERDILQARYDNQKVENNRLWKMVDDLSVELGNAESKIDRMKKSIVAYLNDEAYYE